MLSFFVTYSVIAYIGGGIIGAVLGFAYFLSPWYKTPHERYMERIEAMEKQRQESLKKSEEQWRKATEGMTEKEKEEYWENIRKQNERYLRGEL